MSEKSLDNSNFIDLEEVHTVNCSCCGKIFSPKSYYFIWFGTAIHVCEDPCTYRDFVSSQ